MTASTAGVGYALAGVLRLPVPVHAVVVATGGSTTTDGGAGMLRALGARFTSTSGASAAQGGAPLASLHSVDLRGLDPMVLGADLIALADVDNPLLGQAGAATVFGPQKGATPDQVPMLEQGLHRLVEALESTGHPALAHAEKPGSGAAGGLVFGLRLLGADSVSGANWFLDLLDATEAIRNADLVITGEGSLDQQTLRGKLPRIIADHAARSGIPCTAVAGRCQLTQLELHQAGFTTVTTLSEHAEGRSTANDPALSRELLLDCGRTLARATATTDQEIP